MEYKQERFIQNNFCEFCDKEVEADFMEYEKIASLSVVRFLMLLYGFVFVMFTLSDYYFYGDGQVLFVSMGLRGTALFISVVAFCVVGKYKRFEHALMLVTLTQLAVFVVYLLTLINLHSNQPAVQFMSVMLLIFAVFLIPNKWKNSLVAGTIILVGYVIFSFFFSPPEESPPLTLRAVYLVICLLACAIFLYGRENSRRKQYAAEKLLEFVSMTDRLTGIYNRARFEYLLSLWIKNKRHDPFSLLLFDIDNFKKVNDQHGHTEGDKVLVGTTRVVSENIRDDDDIFARWGGEEFVVLFGVTEIERAVELAERLRKAVEVNPCGEAGCITISIGACQYREGETITDFVKRVDDKMYEAKRAGKNQVVADYNR